MSNKKTNLFFVFFLFFSILLVNNSYSQAIKSVTFPQIESGFDITAPFANAIPVGWTGTIHIHVHNMTDGILITNETAVCNIHIYNFSGKHILQTDLEFSSNGIDFEIDIPKELFNNTGVHHTIVQCNTSTQGGFLFEEFEVTENGRMSPTEVVNDADIEINFQTIFWFVVLLSFGLIFFMHKFKEDTGSSVAYGFLAMTLLLFMGSLLLFGFQVIEPGSVNLPFDLNRLLGLLCVIIGLFAAWFSTSLIKSARQIREESEENE